MVLGVRYTSWKPKVRPKWKQHFKSFVALGAGLLLLGGDAVFMSEREKLVALAAQYSLV